MLISTPCLLFPVPPGRPRFEYGDRDWTHLQSWVSSKILADYELDLAQGSLVTLKLNKTTCHKLPIIGPLLIAGSAFIGR